MAHGARQEFGVLYRVDYDRGSGRSTLLVQSGFEPDWNVLPSDYLVQIDNGFSNPACKKIDGSIEALEPGMRLVFKLRANPTKKIGTKSGPNGERHNGRRVELRSEQDQLNWLRRRGEASGFQLATVRLQPDLPNVRAQDEGRRELKARGHRGNGEDRQMLTFFSVLYEGELVVADAALFRRALSEGIGPGKAYGFGLLSIARR